MSWDDPHAWRASYDAWKLDALDAYSYHVSGERDEFLPIVDERKRRAS